MNPKASEVGQSHPDYTLIVVGDDGECYKLTREKWMKEENRLAGAAGQGVIEQLATFGSYLSFIPADLSVGIGTLCTVVNLKAILAGRPPHAASHDDGASNSDK